ncbi:MAG TPA: hypothetical protein VM925_18075 [Labilithrix sp.]|nr:hypothetical protein [Labilithrix sp.]
MKGELDTSFLATHHFTLEEAPRGYDIFRKRKDGCIRPVFTPA